MRLRIALTLLLWASVVVGALTLFGGAAAPLGLAAAGVGAFVATLGALRARRVRRAGSWRGVSTPEVVLGSRRVSLAEAGIVLPDAPGAARAGA